MYACVTTKLQQFLVRRRVTFKASAEKLTLTFEQHKKLSRIPGLLPGFKEASAMSSCAFDMASARIAGSAGLQDAP